MPTADIMTLDDFDLASKRVLVRVDINVPIQDGQVADDTRIRRVAPTVAEIAGKGGTPILMSHLGRPAGRRDPDLSLELLVDALETLIELPVKFVKEVSRTDLLHDSKSHAPGTVFLLENLRYHSGEQGNSPEFANLLAQWGDIYCNDAFSASHRAHASIVGVPSRLPSCAGRAMMRELNVLESAFASPKRPVAAIVGGAKISTKIGLLRSLANRFEHLVIGGAMANTFLLAKGFPIGRSLAEPGKIVVARDILAHARTSGCQLLLPLDVVVTRLDGEGGDAHTVAVSDCPSDASICDVGERTVARVAQTLELCRTVVWNGPVGRFEIAPFDRASTQIARRIAELTEQSSIFSVAGGGDTLSAIARAGLANRLSYSSTAGGAFIALLEGGELPGIAALERREGLPKGHDKNQ
ncbi:MAG: phosphoglycerate kinase [Rhodobacteraceae bacterium]|nr:phosphoglycerate kinase [Paracoccaceae bacterium]